MKSKFKIVVCASCGGGLFKELINHQHSMGYSIDKLIVNRECGAINIAKQSMIPVVNIPTGNIQEFKKRFVEEITSDIDLIVLAGYLPIIPSFICDLYHKKIINIHPSILPNYGGKGMYGLKVHEAVMENKEKYTGYTIHYVSKEIDGGEIILQEQIEIDYSLSPWQLGGVVFEMSAKGLIVVIDKIMNTTKDRCD